MSWGSILRLMLRPRSGLLLDRAAGRLRVLHHQHRRLLSDLRRLCRPGADGAQRAAFGGAVLARAHSAVRADGRGAVSHRAGHEIGRCRGCRHPPGAGTPCGRHARRWHDLSADLRVDHRDHRDAGLAAAAADARAELRAEDRDGPDPGDRRRRYPDSALRPRRAAGQPRRHLDLRPPGRRHRAGADPQRAVHRLRHAALLDRIRRWRRPTTTSQPTVASTLAQSRRHRPAADRECSPSLSSA